MRALESTAPAADPQHLRYERAISLPAEASGQTCAVLDATVFAHAASAALNDLRLFASSAARVSEVPFNLSESETQPVDVESASVRNLGMHDGDIVFDLEMPHRAYTEVDLDLAAQNFVAVATISGTDWHGASTQLGTFTLFDLSRQGLSRSTTLALQESSFPELHVRLHIAAPDGKALAHLDARMVAGAGVPPSREAQTLYTAVAQTGSIEQRGRQTVATLKVAAHVPVERVSFVLEPSYTKNFLRTVRIRAFPMGAADSADVEDIRGEISRVLLADDGHAEIDNRQLAVNAVLGIRTDGATVEVAVENGDDAPIGLRAVELQMRRRIICFEAVAGNAYTLRYGDGALHAPVYDYARLFQPSGKPAMANLGPEQVNASFSARADDRPYTERHPELLWVGLVIVVAALGTTALQSVKRHGKSR